MCNVVSNILCLCFIFSEMAPFNNPLGLLGERLALHTFLPYDLQQKPQTDPSRLIPEAAAARVDSL